MENKIEIWIKGKLVDTISSDTPSFDKLKKYVLENIDDNFGDVEVKTADSNFDCECLKNALIETINEVKKEIQNEKEKLKQFLESNDIGD